MRLITFVTIVAVLLIADQVRTGGHYRREVARQAERGEPGLKVPVL